MEMGEWYAKYKRPMTVKELRPIALKYFSAGEELTEFYEYLTTPQGKNEFRRELRDSMRRHGISLPPEAEYLPLNVEEPWQMTEGEYRRSMYVGLPTKEKQSEIRETHKYLVQLALSEGKPVPPEVMKDYPDLLVKGVIIRDKQLFANPDNIPAAKAFIAELRRRADEADAKANATTESKARLLRQNARAARRDADRIEATIPASQKDLPQTYVTIEDPGKTTFTKGAVVSPEAFAEENKRVRELGEKEATGWTGEEGEFPDNGNGANEEEYQLRTVRTLESVVRDTTVLASSRYIVKVLDSWDKAAKLRFLEAYGKADWKTVYDLTSDLTGSGYSRSNTRAHLADVLKEHLGEFSPQTTKVDLRKGYDEKVTVPGGTLYRKGSIIQVWWDKWGSETWSHPWVTEKEAIRNFYDMQERWSCVEPKELIPQAKSNLTRQDVEVYISLPPFRVSIWVEPKNPEDLRNIAKWDDDEARKWFEGMQTREQVEEAVLDHLENTGVLIKATPETKIKKNGDRGPEPVRRAKKETDLQFLSDSPEFLANTIEQTGWREQLDEEFQLAIARTRN